MSTYVPGTVAVATVRGVKGVRIVRGDGHWAVATDTDDFYTDRDAEVLISDIRPLVVLDLGADAKDTAALLREILSHWPYGVTHYNGGSHHLAQLADQIEAQTKPPRIPEPGLWGVVEAMSSWDTNTRTEYVRRSTEAGDDGGNNWEDGTGDWFAWPELIDPTLVREGVGS